MRSGSPARAEANRTIGTGPSGNSAASDRPFSVFDGVPGSARSWTRRARHSLLSAARPFGHVASLQSPVMAAPKDQADLSAVSLFPLPNVVLFPRAVLPLHVFEERYKAMIADALRGDRQIAMALLRPGWEKNYHGKPAIEPVVCVGKILTHERLPDGRYNFLLQGHTRARLVRELESDRPYRLAELELLPEDPAMEIDLDEDRRRILATFENGSLT